MLPILSDIPPIRAVLFDLDGTLIDSESLTDRAISDLLRVRSIAVADLDLSQFHGVSWRGIGKKLCALFPSLGEAASVADTLADRCAALAHTDPAPLVPGAAEAFRAASAHFPTAIVTGSNADAVAQFLRRTDLHSACALYVSNEQYVDSKPHPASYRLAAERLALPPASCLVFEDSLPGLRAARAATMPAIAVAHSAPTPPSDLALGCISTYSDLPNDFFSSLGCR